MSAGTAPTIGTVLFVLFGPIVWAGHLLVTYGGHASLCAFGVTSIGRLPTLPVLLWSATAAALALLAGGLLWPSGVRRLLRVESSLETENRWLEGLMRLLTGQSLLGVAYAGVAILLVPNCLPLR